MKTLRKLFALMITVVGLTGTVWAGDLGDTEASLYESHFNQEELENQF
ncbi:MAG: hypothetical protein HY900_30325 [Deltaproteobacteria bacterium]|nr:hypothetical protein [Deltaproteobacteria bacterium]